MADAVGAVLDHPEWLRLDGRTVAVLGAGAEMGPLVPLLRWGARVAAVDLPATGDLDPGARRGAPAGRPAAAADARRRHRGRPGRRPGSTCSPTLRPSPTGWPRSPGGPAGRGQLRVRRRGHERSGGDRGRRAEHPPARATARTRPWRSWPRPRTCSRCRPTRSERRPRRTTTARRTAKVLGRPLRSLSGGRLLRRAYVAGADPGINDSLIPQQGPNYALAKRLQRWRATQARHDGALVSMNVAPPTRTRSVVKNRALAAAYAGAHRFGVEVFEPATSNVLMAALLVHDLHTGGGPTPRAAVAGRGVRRGARRAVAYRVRPPQHPRDGGPVRLGCCPALTWSEDGRADHGVFGFLPGGRA